MNSTKPVSMRLNHRDIANAEKVKEHLALKNSMAESVSAALSISRQILDSIQGGGEVHIINADGEKNILIIPGL